MSYVSIGMLSKKKCFLLAHIYTFNIFARKIAILQNLWSLINSLPLQISLMSWKLAILYWVLTPDLFKDQTY